MEVQKMSKTNKYYENSVVTPLFPSATFFFESYDQVIDYHNGLIKTGRYGRYDNPNWLEAEGILAELDGYEEALIFPSGMSAIATTFLSFLEPGDNIIYTGKGYRNIRALCGNILGRMGFQSKALSPGSTEEFNENFGRFYNEKTKIVFLEIPSNPHLHLVDIEFILERMYKRSVLIVDSTFSSPINFLPKKFGADLVIHSCSKYIGGHADILAGSVAGSHELIAKIRENRNVLGSIAGPLTGFLLTRSLATLKLRMDRFNQSGMKVAEYLENHPKVSRVFYSGLMSHPQFELAKRYLTGHGGVVSFEIDAPAEKIKDFIDRVEIPYQGTNFGSHHAMIEQCSVFTYFKSTSEERREQGITDTLIRLSLNLDDPEKVIEDLESGFKAL